MLQSRNMVWNCATSLYVVRSVFVLDKKNNKIATNNQISLFSGTFHLRKNYGEDFILNLDHWPLGIEKLMIRECE